MKKSFYILLAALAFVSAAVEATPEKLSAAVEGALEGGNEHTGYSFFTIEGDTSYSAVKGSAAPGEVLSPDHMFRIASITKTYTAATILRLVEQGELALDSSLTELIRPSFDAVLRADGYNTDAITLKHVLSHTAGLYDHAQNSKYIQAIMETPSNLWTRSEQIQAAAAWGDPVGAPGERFFYSDTGYLLLGNIIERATGMKLPLAVRDLLKLDDHGLSDTIWERGDARTVPPSRRAHQFMAGQDTHTWDPSVDLYGGGGLVATPADVARFYDLLLGGKIFDKPATLQTMLSADGLPTGSPYRLGIFEKDYEGVDGGTVHVYEHGGFWGTLVLHEPSSGITIAGAASQQEDYPKLVKAMTSFLASKQQVPH